MWVSISIEYSGRVVNISRRSVQQISEFIDLFHQYTAPQYSSYKDTWIGAFRQLKNDIPSALGFFPTGIRSWGDVIHLSLIRSKDFFSSAYESESYHYVNLLDKVHNPLNMACNFWSVCCLQRLGVCQIIHEAMYFLWIHLSHNLQVYRL